MGEQSMSFGTLQIEKMTTESGYSLGAGNASSFKNRIINGEMDIDQRNGGASVTLANGGSAYVYTLDRWAAFSIKNNVISFQQNAGAVTPPVGFSNYIGATSLAATTVAATDITVLKQAIEANNVSDFALGTANAKPFTVSFWARSSLTGTFGGSISNNAVNYIYPFSFAINSANTWEYKTITVTGPTTGTWLTGTNTGLQLFVNLGSGSNFQGTANTWQSSAGGLFTPTGCVNLIATSGATFYLTGVQLEVGTVATSFDFRDFGREVMLCQRYYCKSYPVNVAPANGAGSSGEYQINLIANGDPQIVVQWPVQMRSSPTVTLYNPNQATPAGQWDRGTIYSSANARSFSESASKTIIDNLDVSLTAGYIGIAWSASAEL
jgi:hypothetical protein